MRVRERVLTARLIEKIKTNPEYAKKIGIIRKEAKKKS